MSLNDLLNNNYDNLTRQLGDATIKRDQLVRQLTQVQTSLDQLDAHIGTLKRAIEALNDNYELMQQAFTVGVNHSLESQGEKISDPKNQKAPKPLKSRNPGIEPAPGRTEP